MINVKSLVQSLFEAHRTIRPTVKEKNGRSRFCLQQKRNGAGAITEEFQSWATAPSIGCLRKQQRIKLIKITHSMIIKDISLCKRGRMGKEQRKHGIMRKKGK